jgi:hypothetical protein
MKKYTLLLIIYLLASNNMLYANQKDFRKYTHVKEFYASIAEDAIDIAQENNLPAAAILAIAGLESGYGSGYVAQITGNILSLGAFKSDPELPALYLPYSKSKKTILFDPKEIEKFSKDDLVYKKRAKSYKKDYRPAPYAGTPTHLELLKYNPKLRQKAHYACLNDFATKWINTKSNIKAFRDAKIWLHQQVNNSSYKILLTMKANKGFIERIGGRKNSFNYRKEWPIKVKLIMRKAALVELVYDMKVEGMSFEEAWER